MADRPATAITAATRVLIDSPAGVLALSPLLLWDVITTRRADVDLPRADDLLIRVVEHLLPLRYPAGRARNREEHREHVDGEAHRLVDQARIEVDVRIEFPRDEVLVLERDPLELERHLEQRILARHVEHEIGHALDDLGAGVVRLVDAMAEAHEPAFAGLHALDETRDVVLRADLMEHLQHGFVRAA